MEKIIKVDRVSTVKEALELQNLGVDIIGVSMNDISNKYDNQGLDMKSVFEIKKPYYPP